MWLYKLASRVCIEVAGDHLPDRGRPAAAAGEP
jgi:hypothetical protein